MLVIVALSACEPVGQTPTEEAWVVAGTILDASGEPLAGVEVVADDQVAYDSNVVGITDEGGVYRLELPEMAASWHVTATHTVAYHGVDYVFDLHPIDDAPFAGETGAVRDFEWRLTGERPDGGSYGGFVVGYAEPGEFGFDPLDVELTLVPDGPLVDGSEGATVSGPLESTADGDALGDVALGRYTISADLDGEPLLVRVRNGGDAFGEAVTADFEAPYGSLAIHRIEVELRLP